MKTIKLKETFEQKVQKSVKEGLNVTYVNKNRDEENVFLLIQNDKKTVVLQVSKTTRNGHIFACFVPLGKVVGKNYRGNFDGFTKHLASIKNEIFPKETKLMQM